MAHACWNFAIPALFVLGPVIAARSLGGAAAYGLISASFGIGAVAAGLFVLRVKPRRPLVVGNLLLTLGALPLLALAFSRSVPLICAANALNGFGLVTLNALWSSTMQVLIPDKVRSRVDSYDWLVSLVIMPVGYAVAGPLSSSIGFAPTLVAAAVVVAVPCALVVLVPGIRGVRRTPSGEILGPSG
jgi:MFS family permease